MSLMEQFANPSTFESLGMGEKLAGATVTMCMGLGITFCVLIILWIIIKLMGVAAGSSKKDKKEEAVVTATENAAPAAATTDEMDNAELVAVIAAAIAASENTYVSDLVVRKITRVSGPTNAWNKAGLSECIDSRRM